MNKVDDAEERAERYLRHLGFTDIEPQPEGPRGKFPDFLLDSRIEVEVRRLNINTVDENGKLVSKSKGARSVGDNMRDLLITLGPPLNGVSWFVRAQFKRPFIKWAKLKPAVKRALRAFQGSPQGQTVIEIADNFNLELQQAGNRYSDCFLDGAYDDLDNRAYWTEYEQGRTSTYALMRKRESATRKD